MITILDYIYIYSFRFPLNYIQYIYIYALTPQDPYLIHSLLGIELMVGCHMFIMIETIYHIHIYILYIDVYSYVYIYIYIALRWPCVPTISPLRWPWKKSSFLTRDIPFNIPVNICSYTMRPWMPWGKVGNHGEKLWRCLKKHGENKKWWKTRKQPIVYKVFFEAWVRNIPNKSQQFFWVKHHESPMLF